LIRFYKRLSYHFDYAHGKLIFDDGIRHERLDDAFRHVGGRRYPSLLHDHK